MQSLSQISANPLNEAIFSNEFKWKVKDGSLIEFWNDHWHDSGVLSSQFRNLFNLAKAKNCSLQEMKINWKLALNNELLVWTRFLNDQEKGEANTLSSLIQSTNLRNGADILSWGPFKGNFNTSLCYRSLVNTSGFEGPWKLIWKLKIPSKTKLFLWQLAHKCLPTLSFLLKRNIVDSALCKWCEEEIEDTTHLFWNCSLAKTAWKCISNWWEINIDISAPPNLEDSFK